MMLKKSNYSWNVKKASHRTMSRVWLHFHLKHKKKKEWIWLYMLRRKSKEGMSNINSGCIWKMELMWKEFNFFFFFKKFFLERESSSGGEGQREREDLKQAPHSVWSPKWGSIQDPEIMTWNQDLDAQLTEPPRCPIFFFIHFSVVWISYNKPVLLCNLNKYIMKNEK